MNKNICKVPFGFIEINQCGNVHTCCSAYIKTDALEIYLINLLKKFLIRIKPKLLDEIV